MNSEDDKTQTAPSNVPVWRDRDTNNASTLNGISRNVGLANANTSIQEAFWGINHAGAGSPISANNENHGLTFFTKPNLNLSTYNLAASRILHGLVGGEDENTLGRYIYCSLDPAKQREGIIDSDLVDKQNPFITVLTNSLLSISGWPDIVNDTYTSPEGWGKEQYSMVDSYTHHLETFDLTANFRNMVGDPINQLFHAWSIYMTHVYTGAMYPYNSSIVENEIDYMTRIYRVVLDPTRTRVRRLAICGAAFPTAVALGSTFNYARETPRGSDNDQISIPFRCIGYEYDDPIIIEEFNALVAHYNPAMATEESRAAFMMQVPEDKLLYFNYHCYPRITEDREMQWWISKDHLSQGQLQGLFEKNLPTK